jgi:hypothetical protein
LSFFIVLSIVSFIILHLPIIFRVFSHFSRFHFQARVFPKVWHLVESFISLIAIAFLEMAIFASLWLLAAFSTVVIAGPVPQHYRRAEYAHATTFFLT